MVRIQTSPFRYPALKPLFRTHSRLLGKFFWGSVSHLPDLTLEILFHMKFSYLLSACPALICFFRLFGPKARVILLSQQQIICLTSSGMRFPHKRYSRFLIHILSVVVLIFKILMYLNGIISKIYHASLSRYSCFLKQHLSHHGGLISLLLTSVGTLYCNTDRFSPFSLPEAGPKLLYPMRFWLGVRESVLVTHCCVINHP